jgi:hypothetical protein
MPTYAQPSDYATYKGKPSDYYDDPSRADEKLRVAAGLINASDDIKNYTRGVRYKHERHNPDPSNAAQLTARTRATCAQFDWTESTGDDTGVGALFNSTRVGSVSLTRSTSSAAGAESTPQDSLIAPRALTILAAENMLPDGTVEWVL